MPKSDELACDITFDARLGLYKTKARWHNPAYGGNPVEYSLTLRGARRSADKMIRREKYRRKLIQKAWDVRKRNEVVT